MKITIHRKGEIINAEGTPEELSDFLKKAPAEAPTPAPVPYAPRPGVPLPDPYLPWSPWDWQSQKRPHLTFGPSTWLP